jgi:cytochrome c peroxidase
MMMKRVQFLLPLAAVMVTAVVSAAAPITVTQKGLQFSSAELTVSKGQVVVFMNDDRTPHNITVAGDGMNLNGGLQPPGAEFRVPFSKTGTFAISCGIHPKMKLNVTVQ